MKRIALIVTASVVTIISTTNCNEASRKDVTDAHANVKEAKNDLKDAVTTSNDSLKNKAISNWTSFKKEADFTIAGMEKEITTLKEKMLTSDNAAKVKLKNELNKRAKKLGELKDGLRDQNNEFQKDLSSIDERMISKNHSFQREFKHDIDELGTAFKDFFRDNQR